MPIILEAPISRPAITAKEIVYFAVDLLAMEAHITFASIDSNGASVGANQVRCSLLDADGNPRFTAPEYASIKSALYRLALEDGHVAGTVA